MDIYTKDAVTNLLTNKQDTLISGTNIKTINGNSLLGSGNVTISGGGSGSSVSSADYATANTQLNGLNINGTNYKLLDVKVNDGSSLIIGANRILASGANTAVAIGDCYGATASGNYSTAIGQSSVASRNFSTALGNGSKAIGGYSTAIGCTSKASGTYSTALGYNSEVYVPNQVSFDGTDDNSVRTLALKSTDNIFFRNENVSTSKKTQASYTSGKTLTEVLNEKSLYQHNLSIELSSVHYIYITILNNSATELIGNDIVQVFNAIKPNMTGTYWRDDGNNSSTHAFYISDIVANTSFNINYGSTLNETITMGLVSDIVDNVVQIL